MVQFGRNVKNNLTHYVKSVLYRHIVNNLPTEQIMQSTKEITFDTRAIIKNFGGVAQIQRLYSKNNLQISRSAINNWMKRRAIHGKQIATLIRLAERENIRFNVEEYVIETTETVDS